MAIQASEKSSRIPGVDTARFLSAAAVIWIHSVETPQGELAVPICRIAVPFFVVAMTILNLKSLAAPSLQISWVQFARSRFQKLYVPFLLWSVVYLVLRIAKHQFIAMGDPILVGPFSFLTGTATHLWFLPCSLILCLTLPTIGRLLSTANRTTLILRSTLFLALGFAAGHTEYPFSVQSHENPISYFAAMSWGTLPAFFITVALAPWLSAKTNSILILAGWLGLSTSVVLLCFPPFYPILPSLGGLSLWLACQHPVPKALVPVVSRLGSLTFGIYLSHLMFVECLQAVAHRIGFASSLALDVCVASTALLGSTLVSWAASGRPLLRQLFPS